MTCTLKESFEVESKHGPFYTGGNVEWSIDGKHLFGQNSGIVTVLSVDTGSVEVSLGETKIDQNEDSVNSFTVSHDNQCVVTHHKSGLFKLWNWRDDKLMKIWKSIHKGPVARITLSSNGLAMASGGSDSSIRLWDLQHHVCTHNFKGILGVVSVVAFHPDAKKDILFGTGDNTKIYGWSTKSRQQEVVLSGHFSKVTSLSFHKDGIHLVSSGRDKVLILWNIKKGIAVRTLPTYEGIEGAFILPEECKIPVPLERSDGIYVASAGEKGIVRVWEMRTGLEIYTQENSLVSSAKAGSLAITQLRYNAVSNSLAVISVDHNIIIHSLDTFKCRKQLVGYSDDILDVVYLCAGNTHLAAATNSPDIKLYELLTMDCQLLCGHTDIVLSLGTTPANENLLISSSKDNSIRIWLMNVETMKMACIGSAVKHTAPIGSVAVSQMSTKFFASVSQDLCLKLWDLPKKIVATDSELPLTVTYTELAHQKDINSVAISPNDRLIATGSQDKIAKLWAVSNLQLLGTFRGHRRGVWCVRFSPIDQVLLTTSADCTVKIWSLTDLNCLKTLEGHESSVLRGEFLSRGMQLITTGADGLLKLWSVKTSECITTLEQHDDRVWALAVHKKETHVVSGGSNSLVTWRDVTQEKLAKAAAEKEQFALEEQKLANLLKADHLMAALKLALKLERPFQVLRIVEDVIKRSKEGLKGTLHELKSAQKEALLRCAISWNTNSRNSQAAQLVINILLNEVGSEELQTGGLTSSLEAMIPYTERHFKRLTQLMQDLHLLVYTVNRTKPHNTVGIS